jgi:hypothetical protein
LQLVRTVSFVRLGAHLVHAAPEPLTLSGGLQRLAAGTFSALIVLRSAIVHAAIGWAPAHRSFISSI